MSEEYIKPYKNYYLNLFEDFKLALNKYEYTINNKDRYSLDELEFKLTILKIKVEDMFTGAQIGTNSNSYRVNLIKDLEIELIEQMLNLLNNSKITLNTIAYQDILIQKFRFDILSKIKL